MSLISQLRDFLLPRRPPPDGPGGPDDPDDPPGPPPRPPRPQIAEGQLYREQSTPEVYVIHDGAKVWIPTPDALFNMGYDWSRVQVVPDGTLAPFQKITIESSSPTPGCLVFPPENHKYYALTNVASTTRVVSRGGEIRIIELRGWLRHVDDKCNASDPDFHYDLEVDAVWAESRGIDLNQIIKVGNILISPYDYGREPKAVICTPLIHVELNGWGFGSTLPGALKPTDWTFSGVAGEGCANVEWPFNPLRPSDEDFLPLHPVPAPDSLQSGQYVKIIGSLLSDEPHSNENDERDDAKEAWAGGRSHWDADNPARWTEIHPPDTIRVLEDRKPTETLKAVAVIAKNGFFSGEERFISADILAPPARPSTPHRLAYRELVGPETILESIDEGNANKDGARIDVFDDRIRIYVRVKGKSRLREPGKFKALYRVWWEAV